MSEPRRLITVTVHLIACAAGGFQFEVQHPT
jgi:hypothetical protein